MATDYRNVEIEIANHADLLVELIRGNVGSANSNTHTLSYRLHSLADALEQVSREMRARGIGELIKARRHV